ncbi:hypothetical protein [Tunturiibacter gelidiferens]|uniref:hypothetical protein n=1 Tax=Tunturiibacter gelidiferens TaxID=3069689 RepID=UPI003D9BA90B
MFRPKPPAVEPTMPPAHPFHDARYGVTFTVPAAWELNRKDSEVSTFNLDARSVAHTTQLRAVASIGFNPHPNSTFSGAFFYFSVTPHLSSAECSAQATARDPRTASSAEIGGIPFTRGYDEHGGICTESRDEIYTTAHNNSCYRFDAVINTFCGGDVSGVQDISPANSTPSAIACRRSSTPSTSTPTKDSSQKLADQGLLAITFPSRIV